MDDKGTLKRRIYALQFALLELALYLDTHPCDEEALKLRTMWMKELDGLKADYCARFGQLVLTQKDVPADNWCWINDPWPWDFQKEG